MLKKIVVLASASVLASFAHADADCTAHAKSEWKSEAEARAKFESEGYQIKKLKISGNCYEIYGFNKEGKKAEIYFDTKTLGVVKTELK